MRRSDLAEKLEVIGQLFEIKGMRELLAKFDPEVDEKGKKKPIDPVKFSAIVIQVAGLMLRENQYACDKILCMSMGVTQEEVDKLDDAEYSNALKGAIVKDVIGFFGSSPSTAGQK